MIFKMKTITYLPCVLFTYVFNVSVAKADIPFMPFKFELTTEKSEYLEGEQINFIVSITNTDKKNTHPVLIPANQNTGAKLFYFEIHDAAKNFSRPIETETRELQYRMVHESPRFPEVVMLKPGEQITFNAFLNSPYLNSRAESHHWFNYPLLPGRYRIYGHYNPSKTFVGDTLYNIYDFNKELPDNGKLNFESFGEVTLPCDIIIRRSDKSKISFPFHDFTKKNHRDSNTEVYYIDDTLNFAMLKFSEKGEVTSLALFDYKYKYPWKWDLNIVYFENGNIWGITKRDDLSGKCPAEYFRKEYYNDTLLKSSTEIMPDSSVQVIQWNEKGEKTWMEIYSADRKLLISYRYNPQTGRIKKKQKEKNPCLGYYENK